MCLYTAIVSFGKVTPEQKQEVEKFGLAIYSWTEFLQLVGYSFHLLLLNKFNMKAAPSLINWHNLQLLESPLLCWFDLCHYLGPLTDSLINSEICGKK